MTTAGSLTYWHTGMHCCNPRWESAYERFETPEQEKSKFRQRFRQMGFEQLGRDLRVVDLFCGRGNGLRALQEMGFRNLTGVDLSPSLLQQAPPEASRIVADCTDLRFEPGSVDIFVVQGGLHHLPSLSTDLPRCLDEVIRSLAPAGLFCVVEPWNTPFLRAVHLVCSHRLMRRLIGKFNAFATMVEEERTTYYEWLSSSSLIQAEVAKRFVPRTSCFGWGKWTFVGGKCLNETA
jgi:ubiquinone/menaquinone biosynthesis C-methylase UbiE